VRLRDVSGAVRGLEVVRDGEFESLGLLFHEYPAMLVCLYDARFRNGCENPAVACVITGRELAAGVSEHLGLATSDSPRERFFDLHRYLGSSTDFYGSDFPSEISPGAVVHPGAHVAPRRVRIAAGCAIEPGAVVLEGSVLGEGVVVRAGAVVGAEGFHPVPYKGELSNMPHYGAVQLGRRVEVGANSVVCRSVFRAATEIGEESILGPLVYVAHGVRIGSRCRLAASARVAGSALIGDEVFIGPGAVVSNRIVVGDRARVSLGSVVVRNVPSGRTVTGNFAVEHDRFLAVSRRLLEGTRDPDRTDDPIDDLV
jgi:UDP-3-O-[3-hydroxymyristoyl] glucosamine N-acyltransferase